MFCGPICLFLVITREAFRKRIHVSFQAHLVTLRAHLFSVSVLAKKRRPCSTSGSNHLDRENGQIFNSVRARPCEESCVHSPPSPPFYKLRVPLSME